MLNTINNETFKQEKIQVYSMGMKKLSKLTRAPITTSMSQDRNILLAMEIRKNNS